MRIGSLFSGIGGLELGIERAIPGARTVFQVESDPYARLVLARHWPNARRYNDVRQVNAGNLPACDLLCGGFPCQDISDAGTRIGVEGSRSGLWSEYARLIGELRPRFVVVENVAALRLRGLGRVLGDLAASGYDAIWDCIPAQAVGAPHRRDRLFIVAWSVSDTDSNSIRDGAEWKERGRIDLQGGGLTQPLNDGKDRAVAHTDSERQLQPGQLQGQERGRACNSGELFARSLGYVQAWKPEPGVGRVADGVPRRVDRLRCLGNAVVPQVAEVVGRVVASIGGAV